MYKLSVPDSAELETPFLEMCISCNGLPYNMSMHDPDTFASVHYRNSPCERWRPHSHTEIVEVRNAWCA